MNYSDKINSIKEMFDVFDDPMDKYIQIIELGKKNKGLPTEEKNNLFRIFGCASLAWVKVKKINNRYTITTDSDTFIVKGLLNILKMIIDGLSKEEIEKIDINIIFEKIGLDNSITSQRTNGFLSAIDKIKEQL